MLDRLLHVEINLVVRDVNVSLSLQDLDVISAWISTLSLIPHE